MKDFFEVIKERYVTEKAKVLEELQSSESNPSIARCKTPKYTFIVDKKANKQEIARAVEGLYKDQNIKVTAVNTITMKPKRAKRGRGKGRPGASPSFKKAIVSLEAGDKIEGGS